MKISFAITVCNELEEIKRLVPFLLEHKRSEDEIVILYDEQNGNSEVIDFLTTFDVNLHKNSFEGNFADWKNKLNSYCTGDYIFQLDADEMISEYLIKSLSSILELNPKIDLIWVPRINTVEGITQEHINKWGWHVNEYGYINFPDMQGRIYKKNMGWYGKVHEKIVGGQKFSALPVEELYCIKHPKTIERQEKQNNFYNTI